MHVSVCIPTVNRLSYLGEALASVAAQTFHDLEVVIADNSADQSYNDQVRSLVSSFPSLACRVFHHPKRISMVENANFLIDHAAGECWLYLPDDDRMRPECLEVLTGALDGRPEAGFAFSDHWIIRADGTVDQAASETFTKRYQRSELRSGFVSRERLFRLALNQSFVLQAMLFRREVIKAVRFSPSSGNIPDLDLELRLTQLSPPVGACYREERLIEYRLHGDQFTSENDARQVYRQIISSLEQCRDIPPDCGKQYRQKLAANHVALALKEAASGDKLASIHHLRKGLKLDPRSFRAYMYLALVRMPRGTVAHLQGMIRSIKRMIT